MRSVLSERGVVTWTNDGFFLKRYTLRIPLLPKGYLRPFRPSLRGTEM